MRATVVASFGCLGLALLVAQCGTSQQGQSGGLSDATSDGLGTADTGGPEGAGPGGGPEGAAADGPNGEGLSSGPGAADQSAPDVAIADSTGAGGPARDALLTDVAAPLPALYDRLASQERRIEQLERENAELRHGCVHARFHR